MRLSSSRSTAILHRPQQDFLLWDRAGTRPSLDQQFADRKDLIDAISGQQLITHTRASSGTYVGSDGLIKTATTNLLLRSEEFETTWVLPGLQSFGSGSIANAIAAPDGTTTADKLVEDNSPSASQHYAYQLVPIIAGLPYTVSVYAKAAERQEIFLALATFNSAFLSNTSSYFNLVSGTTRTVGINATASIVDAGGGWYRCSLTGIAQTSTTAIISGGAISNGSTFFYAGDGTSGIYLWGAQLEQSSTVGEYIPTTSTINSAPRFDHDPTTGESLGLLVEESRVNYCLQSEAFGTSPWSASNVTVTADQETAPDGATTADELEATSSNGTVTQPVTTTAVDMTFSVYLKRKTGTGNIDITADGTTWVTQTISDTAWTRCVVTQTAVAGTSNPGIRIVTSGDEVYAWGGQYE